MENIGGILRTILALESSCDSREPNCKLFEKGVCHPNYSTFKIFCFNVMFRSNLSIQVKANEIFLSTVLALKLNWIYFFLRC